MSMLISNSGAAADQSRLAALKAARSEASQAKQRPAAENEAAERGRPEVGESEGTRGQGAVEARGSAERAQSIGGPSSSIGGAGPASLRSQERLDVESAAKSASAAAHAILQEQSKSLLAQANARPEKVLALLQASH